MVKTKEDLTGKTFGRLTVLKQVEDYIRPNGKHEAQWLCECSCDKHKQIKVLGQNLKKKNGTKSCGCLKSKIASELGKSLRKGNCFELNLYDEYGAYGIGYCSNTNSKFYFDMDDYDKIKDYTWYEHYNDKNSYHSLLSRDPKLKKSIKMTRIIGCVGYDHKDRNPLNNRKYNLRKATVIENSQNQSRRKDNSSGIIGVYFNSNANKWQSYITVNKKYVYLGVFNSKEEAIKVRLKAEKKYFGEFAPQKNLFEQYKICEYDIDAI